MRHCTYLLWFPYAAKFYATWRHFLRHQKWKMNDFRVNSIWYFIFHDVYASRRADKMQSHKLLKASSTQVNEFKCSTSVFKYAIISINPRKLSCSFERSNSPEYYLNQISENNQRKPPEKKWKENEVLLLSQESAEKWKWVRRCKRVTSLEVTPQQKGGTNDFSITFYSTLYQTYVLPHIKAYKFITPNIDFCLPGKVFHQPDGEHGRLCLWAYRINESRAPNIGWGFKFFNRVHVHTCIDWLNHRSSISIITFPRTGKGLTQLDVSQNQLQNVPQSALKNLHHLLILNLNHNKISVIHNRAFEGLDTLEILTLYENRITGVEPDAFRGLDKWALKALFYAPFTHVHSF